LTSCNAWEDTSSGHIKYPARLSTVLGFLLTIELGALRRASEINLEMKCVKNIIRDKVHDKIDYCLVRDIFREVDDKVDIKVKDGTSLLMIPETLIQGHVRLDLVGEYKW